MWLLHSNRKMYLPILVAVVTKVIYTGNTVKRFNSGTITVQPGLQYSVNVEILRNDLASSSEKVQDITLDGISIGGCNPDGNDFDCTFFNCPITSASVVSQGTNSIEKKYVFRFGLRNGLRFQFDSDTCINYPFANIFFV